MLPKTHPRSDRPQRRRRGALDYACELAATFGATVHLLNVIGIPALGVPELGVALTSTMIDSDGPRQPGRARQARRRTGAAAQIGQVLLRTGDARDVINQTAKELGADLIVMGTHGRRGVVARAARQRRRDGRAHGAVPGPDRPRTTGTTSGASASRDGTSAERLRHDA